MSASRSSYSKQDRVFQFSMEFPVPSYLVALVAGDLQHVDVGPRSVPGSWFGSAACFSSSRNQFPGHRLWRDTAHVNVCFPGVVCGRSHACCLVR